MGDVIERFTVRPRLPDEAQPLRTRHKKSRERINVSIGRELTTCPRGLETYAERLLDALEVSLHACRSRTVVLCDLRGAAEMLPGSALAQSRPKRARSLARGGQAL
jgi:hypothetical protein